MFTSTGCLRHVGSLECFGIDELTLLPHLVKHLSNERASALQEWCEYVSLQLTSIIRTVSFNGIRSDSFLPSRRHRATSSASQANPQIFPVIGITLKEVSAAFLSR